MSMDDIYTYEQYEVALGHQTAFVTFFIVIFSCFLMTKYLSLTLFLWLVYTLFIYGDWVSSILGGALGIVSAYAFLHYLKSCPNNWWNKYVKVNELMQFNVVIHIVLIPITAGFIMPKYVSENSYPSGVVAFYVVWMFAFIISCILEYQQKYEAYEEEFQVKDAIRRHIVWAKVISVTVFVQYLLSGELAAYTAPFIGILAGFYAALLGKNTFGK